MPVKSDEVQQDAKGHTTEMLVLLGSSCVCAMHPQLREAKRKRRKE